MSGILFAHVQFLSFSSHWTENGQSIKSAFKFYMLARDAFVHPRDVCEIWLLQDKRSSALVVLWWSVTEQEHWFWSYIHFTWAENAFLPIGEKEMDRKLKPHKWRSYSSWSHVQYVCIEVMSINTEWRLHLVTLWLSMTQQEDSATPFILWKHENNKINSIN